MWDYTSVMWDVLCGIMWDYTGVGIMWDYTTDICVCDHHNGHHILDIILCINLHQTIHEHLHSLHLSSQDILGISP